MRRRFVIEAVMIATYGHLLVPSRPVDFVVPYSSIAELYDMRDGTDPVMEDPDDDGHVKTKINELITFFEDSLNRKKIEKALQMPWRESSALLLNEMIQFTVVHAVDNAHYGELFDPIETEMLLTGLRLEIPLLSDQYEFQDKLIEAEVPVQVYDIEDFEFAVEEGISSVDMEL
ncbi:ADP-heptose synthase [Paenibacillus sp. GSMTC-2017]|uniref:ADP-heptose synthase n=1 Tax=Paenibacillus sp. GSMTC-2017 TaxID=2794350 RepID=UPI0018D665F5|nr:ADP-heptose synthase [Paenibacillus sp. GSMTC-2017]MBH5317729.1 ADP-heptose synthase [Paenibacillus sp. GSMTC-2017]